MKSKLKILVVFIVMFCASFIPDQNHELFGDWKCKGRLSWWDDNGKRQNEGCRYGAPVHDPSWHWGTRHWIWLFTGITFSIWTIAEVIIDAEKKSKCQKQI